MLTAQRDPMTFGWQVPSDDCCPICLAEVEMGQGVVKLGCTHAFHAGCIESWLKVRELPPPPPYASLTRPRCLLASKGGLRREGKCPCILPLGSILADGL